MHYTLALLHDDQSSKAAEIFNQAMVQSAYAEIPDAVRDRASETGDNRELNSYVQKYAILAERADPGNPDVVGLEAAAHLILGMIPPQHGMVSLNYRIDQTKAAMRLRPNWGKVYFTYAQLLRQARRYREAQVAEARALQLGDLDAIAKRDRERAIAQQHKADMARWRVVRIPRTTPDPQMQAFIDNAHKWVQTHKK